MSTNNVCNIEWITIPAPDIDAAKSFYSNCFGFTYEHYNDSFAVFKSGNLSGGFDQNLVPSDAGIGFSVTVDSMNKTVELVVDNGGSILIPPYEIGPNAGYCAKFSDPNGNVLELYSTKL